MARWTASARCAEAMTTVGSVSPLGKCSASVEYPSTDSACTRNCSVWDRPSGVARMPVHSSASAPIETAATGAGRRATADATRCQTPLSVSARAPILGMNGQNSFRPNRPSSGGSTNSTKTAATTSPEAACTPRLRVVGASASSSVSRASTTVALDARMAGAARRTAMSSASRGDSWRPSSSR